MTAPINLKNSFTFPVYHTHSDKTSSLLNLDADIKRCDVTTSHIACEASITTKHALEIYKRSLVSATFSSETKPLIPIDSFAKKINITFLATFLEPLQTYDFIEVAYGTEISKPQVTKYGRDGLHKASCEVVFHVFHRTLKGHISSLELTAIEALVCLQKPALLSETFEDPIAHIENLNQSTSPHLNTPFHNLAQSWQHASMKVLVESLL